MIKTYKCPDCGGRVEADYDDFWSCDGCPNEFLGAPCWLDYYTEDSPTLADSANLCDQKTLNDHVTVKKVYVVGVSCYTGLAVVKVFRAEERAKEFCKSGYYDYEEMEIE